MPSPTKRWILGAALLCLAALPGLAQGSIHYHCTCPSPGWEQVFHAFRLSKVEDAARADLSVACSPHDAPGFLDQLPIPNRLLVLEGDSPLARSLGFVPAGETPVEVRNVRDHHNPELLIVWETPLSLVPTRLPHGAKVLAEDRWSRIPLVAAFRHQGRSILWLAAGPGNSGYARFPYLGNALVDAGFEPPLHARSLWAFLDTAYRRRADPAFLAQRWRSFGIAAVHVSAWQHWERDPAADAWLRSLIEACHQHGILVYAWLEFPHVSERFWQDHPTCREQTALGQDAHLDWRKLINLSDPACAARIRQQSAALIGAFDWDGVNLAEVYYESLQGPSNPARFTPMNQTIRTAFEAEHGFDPAELFRPGSPLHHQQNPDGLRHFLRFRRERIASLHTEWMTFLQETVERTGKAAHLMVTQIDDQFDATVRDHLAADSRPILSLMHQSPFTFLIEDPATIWHLGPNRYQDIANAYAPLTPYPQRLAIDINIFPRYQEVYPTRQQTGMELYQLVSSASRHFPRVALYAEHTLSAQDLPLLAASAAPAATLRREGSAVCVDSPHPVGLRWQGPALVNGRPWPARDDRTLWLPAGRHCAEPGDTDPPLRLLHLSARLRQVRAGNHSLQVHYESETTAIVQFSHRPMRLLVDGVPLATDIWRAHEGYYLRLPAGEHLLEVDAEPTPQDSQ